MGSILNAFKKNDRIFTIHPTNFLGSLVNEAHTDDICKQSDDRYDI